MEINKFKTEELAEIGKQMKGGAFRRLPTRHLTLVVCGRLLRNSSREEQRGRL